MNRKIDDCAKSVLEAAKSLVGEKEISEAKLQELGEELSGRARALRRLNGVEYQESLRQAAEQFAADQEIDLDNEERQFKLQKVINNGLVDHLKRFDNKIEGVISVLAGSEKPIKGAGSGLEQLMLATERDLFAGESGWVTKLSRGDLLNKLLDPENEVKIVDAVLELLDKRELPTIDKNNEIQKIARIIIDKNEDERRLQNGYGANIPRNFNRISTTRWNRIKIKQMGVTNFVNLERELIDWDRSFPELDVDKREKALKDFYNDITSGIRTENSQETLSAIVGRTKFFTRLHQNRVFYFKDGASWVKHMHEVGNSPLPHSLLLDTIKTAKNTAFLKQLGPRAEQTIDRLINHVKHYHPETPGRKFKYLTNIVKELNSVTDPSADYQLARIGGNLRRFQSWKSLGLVTVRSWADLAMQANTLKYNGVGWFDRVKTNIDSAIGLFKSDKDQKDFLDLIGIGAENNIGQNMRFENLHAQQGLMSTIDRIYYRLNYLQKWDRTLKSQTSSMLGRFLAQNQKLKFNELNERQRVGLERYNIDNKQWDLLRKHEIKLSNGKTMILPDSADRATTEEYKKYLDNPNATGVQIKRARDKIHDNLMMYFADNERHVILDSGAKERALLYFGLPRGTVLGEAVRTINQFRTYGTAFYTRSISRQIALGLGTKDGLTGMLELVVGTMIYNGISYYAASLIKGQKPDLTNPTVLANMTAGAFGILGDLTRSVFDSSDQSFTGSLLGPSARTLEQATTFVSKVSDWRKHPYKPGSALWNLAKHNIPFANLYFADAFLRWSLLNRISDRIEPGSVRRTNNYLRREHGLTSILPK